MVLYAATVALQYSQAPFQPWSVWEPGAAGQPAARPGGRVHRGGPPAGLPRRRPAHRLARRAGAEGRRAAGRRVDDHRQPPGLQRAHHRQPDDGAGDERPRRPHPDVQPGGRDHHRPRRGTPRRAGRPPTCWGSRRTSRPRSSRSGPTPGAGGRTTGTGGPTGREIDLGLSATTLETSAGTSGFLFTFQDVTTIRRLERDARMQQRLAAVGEMAAGIAHEIRNPLASISGSMQILRKELALNGEQSQLMDIVLRESERLNQTIQQLPGLRRPQRFGIARLDLRPVLQDAALLLRNSAEVGQDHVVDVDVPDAAGLVRGRRGPGAAGHLEPGDQRPAGDAGRRPAAPRRAARARRRGRRAGGAGRGRRAFPSRSWTPSSSRSTARSRRAAASGWRSSTAS